MGSIWSTCDSGELKEKESISLQPLEKVSQHTACKLGGASLLATTEKGLYKSTNNFSNIPASYYPTNNNCTTQIKNVTPLGLPSPQASTCKSQAQTTSQAFAGNLYQTGGYSQYWLDGDSYDEEDISPYVSPSQPKPKANSNIPIKNRYNNTQIRTYQQQQSNIGRKNSSDFSDSSSDSSNSSDIEFSDFITFILSYNPLTPKKKPIPIPSSFQDESTYRHHFEHAFYIELDAILEQALGEAFLSNSYRLNLNVQKRYASISERDSDEAVFENEIRNDDIVLIIPDQGQAPKNFKELQNRNINWTLGLVNKGKNNNITISLDPSRKKLFKVSRKYIATSIGNITPVKREFDALGDFEDLSLGSQILNPKVCVPVREKCIPTVFMNTIRNKNYNSSQVDAIKNSIQSDGKISLIQGPPGTGKTTTVVGILSGLLAINPKCKILVCAQSNAAVDEIASTVLRKGIFDIYGIKRKDISLLRIGEKKQKHELGVEEEEKTPEEIEMTVHSIRLGEKLERLLKEKNSNLNITEIIKDIEKLEKQIEGLKKENNYNSLSTMRELYPKLSDLRKKRKNFFGNKNKCQKDLIKNSDVIFCTLSGAGSFTAMKNIKSIDYLIIDEACQSLEVSTSIPFLYNPKSIILIGDPKQLPATTFSEKSKINRYDRSLFERMTECNIKPVLLCEQYRMMREISDFTSKTFYKNQIRTGNSINNRTIPSWVYPEGLFFFNISTSREKVSKGSMSYYNIPEAQFALELYEVLRTRIGRNDAHIGIISPYKGQVQHIEKLLFKRYGNSWKNNCEVSSVDGFQGREVDIVIFSAVRSGKIGFLKDERRMNVAISRAKYGMYAIGNETCLARNPKWKSLIDYCKEIRKYESCNSFKRVKRIFSNQ